MVATRKPWDAPGLKQHQMEKQPRRFQAKNPERSMVAARKPWDAPGLKMLQKLAKSRTFHGSRPQTMGCAWPQTIPMGNNQEG